MGCDIHMYVEKRNNNGCWDIIKTEDDGNELLEPYDGRNYNLFSILANVRNGRGFAGCRTGEGFNQISSPRGIPIDASDEYVSVASEWGCDGHSHSYLTLKELLDYDWTQETQLQGWVDMIVWEKWSRFKKKSFPENYCGFVDGGNTKHISQEEADNMFDKKSFKERISIAKENENKYALAKWSAKYYECASDFLSQSVHELLKISNGIDGADDVRIVFFFDN